MEDDDSIMCYNGGAIIAMRGKNCVAIASDKRFGVKALTMADDMQKIFQLGPHLFVGLPGLASDTLTVFEKLRFRVNVYELRENRSMSPRTFSRVTSHLLYEKRFGPYYVEPIVAGLDPRTFEPYISSLDLLGCTNEPQDFVVSGSCPQQMYGMCEAVYEPDMSPEVLFENISQALLNAFDRDALSGWGAVVHVIEKDKITTKDLRTRMD